MSLVNKSLELFLPPDLPSGGKVYGYLQLNVENVYWTTTNKFPKVEIQLKWWGESEETLIRYNSTFSQVQPLRYQISTNYRLLQSYLSHCEPISARIFSIKNKDFIGHASIVIPAKLHNLKDPVKSVKTVCPILSARNYKIGEMTVSFNVNFDSNQIVSIKTKPEKENQKRVHFKLNEKANKENIKVVGTKMPLTTRDRRPPTQTTLKSRNFPSINQNASRRSSTVSQSSSISASTSSTLKSSIDDSIVSHKSNDSVIDFVRIGINSLELNFFGLSQVHNFIGKLSDQKCIVKCAVTSKHINAALSDDSNFISYVFDAATQKIDFRKKDLLFSIRSANGHHAYLNFGFCITSLEGEIHPIFIGLTRINLNEILSGSFIKKLPVVSEKNEKIGNASISINMGNRVNSRDDFHHRPRPPVPIRFVNQSVQTISCPSTSNDCENPSEKRDHENKNVQTNETRMRHVEKSSSDMEDNNNRDTEMVDVEMKETKTSSKVYHVLLFIESLKNVKDENFSREYFITYEGFWNQCQESTESSVNHIFNYLKQSPIMCDESFLKRVQSNHLELKLWERSSDNSEKLVGSTRVSLHQFYIAFKDAAMIEHLSTNKSPIISTDSWCNFISPISSELFCNGKVLLAIGSEHQIDFLIMSRDLHRLKPPTKIEQRPEESAKFSDTNAQLKSRLSAFIESLSQKLPEPSSTTIENHQKIPLLCSSPSNCSSSPQIRKTSDLLDSLQKALAKPPTTNDLNLFSQMNQAQNISSISQTNNDDIRMVVTIESAANLPKIVKKIRNKKNKNKTSPQQKTEYEPMSYATFEASIGDENQASIVKSHEGNVYCTKVVKGCHPSWNEHFEVGVSFDVLRNPQKKFVIKVWRKAKFDQQTELRPAPFEDAVIGFSAIDLSALLTGLPILSGYYNIVDFSGRTNGQINLSFKPLQDVDKFRSPSSPLVPLACPLNIDVNCVEMSEGNSVLSRTLKRKFTELDEITQRLKARLFDVTGDENLEVDEEFERDLNTVVDEDENLDEKENFGWLSEGAMDFQQQLNKILESQQPSTSKGTAAPSTSTIPTHREISGCSSSDEAPPLAIDHLLKKYDLDTLINPSIFKNIIDPNIANSDSTPTLQPLHASTKSNEDENLNESGETTVSSIISNDQLQTIEKALQRTSLHENEKDRKEPEGEMHVSE